MDLLDRYLTEVRQSLFLMPAKKRDDILQELSENLRSELEEKETQAGRPLTEREQEEILQRSGHPLLVAGRYRQESGSVSFGRRFIGPELFPLYSRILALNVSLTALVMAVIVLMSRGDIRMAQLLPSLVVQALIVTGVFVAADASMRRSVARGWTMRPPAPESDPLRIPRASTIFEIGFLLFFANVWIDLPLFPDSWSVPGQEAQWTPGPIWNDFQRTFFIPVLLVTGVSLALAFANLLRPFWTRLRLAVSAATNLAFATMIGMILARHWSAAIADGTLLASGQSALSRIDIAAAWTNLSVFVTMAVIAIVCAWQAASETLRALRMQPSPAGVGLSMAASN